MFLSVMAVQRELAKNVAIRTDSIIINTAGTGVLFLNDRPVNQTVFKCYLIL